MKKWMFLLLGCMTIIMIAGCQSTPNVQKPQEKQTVDVSLKPEESYANNCSSCHGGNLEGGMGPSLQKIGSKFKKEEIEKIIQNGKGSMPGQPQVSGEARGKLAEWLVTKK